MDKTPPANAARLPTGAAIVAFHEECLGRPGWPVDEAVVQAAADSAARAGHDQAPAEGWALLWQWIATNHRYNCLLWAEEDLARRTRVSDSDIARNKRNIDGFNQARNDATERVDELLLVDRLSILALKVHAMALQTQRSDVDDAHRQASAARLERLRAQRDDLAGCYDRLIDDCRAGRAYFKVYRQFKMYNDPRFNPALVAESAGRG
jgi:hypothetical protein